MWWSFCGGAQDTIHSQLRPSSEGLNYVHDSGVSCSSSHPSSRSRMTCDIIRRRLKQMRRNRSSSSRGSDTLLMIKSCAIGKTLLLVVTSHLLYAAAARGYKSVLMSRYITLLIPG